MWERPCVAKGPQGSLLGIDISGESCIDLISVNLCAVDVRTGQVLAQGIERQLWQVARDAGKARRRWTSI